MSKSVKGYKGFDKDFKCQNKQYEENTTYEEHGLQICEEGMMHFCENPFDVLGYYPLLDNDANFNQFAEVEGLGNIERQENKTASNKLHIGAKLSFNDFIKACIDFTFESVKVDKNEKADINNSYSAQMASSGDYAKMASSGDNSTIKSKGKSAVVAAIGTNNIASAKKGSWITLAEFEKEYEESRFIGYKPICVKTEFVDGERIKEDTFYKLENGKFTEVEEDEL